MAGRWGVAAGPSGLVAGAPVTDPVISLGRVLSYPWATLTVPALCTYMGGTMRNFAMPALAAVAVFALAGCGGSDDKTDSKSSTAPSSASSTPAAPAIPSPDEAQAKALTTVLDTLKPGLGSDDDDLSNARNVCLDLKQGKDDATAAKNAAARYGTDEVIGAAIVAAVKTSFCS